MSMRMRFTRLSGFQNGQGQVLHTCRFSGGDIEFMSHWSIGMCVWEFTRSRGTSCVGNGQHAFATRLTSPDRVNKLADCQRSEH